MQYGEVPVAEAEGCILAHSVRAGEVKLAKGLRLGHGEIELLLRNGIHRVIAVRLSENDIGEDEAARQIAHAFPPDHFAFSEASTGRVNIFAGSSGLFRASKAVVDRLNRVDPAITIACLKDCASVETGEMVATIKIIPLAVASHAVQTALDVLADTIPFEVKPYSPFRVHLISTQLPALKPSVMDKTRRLLEERLRPSASQLTGETRLAHRADAVAEAILKVRSGNDLIVIFGASAVADPHDVIPDAIRISGGSVSQVGLPVDPGNLLVLGECGGKPVIGAPGCARSARENAFDWVIARIFAGDPPSCDDMTGWGVGGLLMEIPSRPSPRLRGKPSPKNTLHVAAVVLAAGKASRMGSSGKHKLLATFEGEPLIRRSLLGALRSNVDETILVTGFRVDDLLAMLKGLDYAHVHNPDYQSGMASSLKAGLSRIADSADGVLVLLADMPNVTSQDIDLLIGAFRERGGQSIVRAVSNGKRGNPVILPRSAFSAVASLEGDIGARPIVESGIYPVVDVEIGTSAAIDTDTPEEIIAAGGVLLD